MYSDNDSLAQRDEGTKQAQLGAEADALLI